MLSVLQFRLNRRYVQADPPFVAIELDQSDSGREGCAVSTLTITSEPKDWRGAIQVLQPCSHLVLQVSVALSSRCCCWIAISLMVQLAFVHRGLASHYVLARISVGAIRVCEPVGLDPACVDSTAWRQLDGHRVLQACHMCTVQVAIEEVRRLQRFGVTAGELERYKMALLRDSAQAAEQALSVPSADQLDFIMESLALGHTVLDQRQVRHRTLYARISRCLTIAGAFWVPGGI